MDIKSYIIQNNKQPIVFPKFKISSNWKVSSKTPESIAKILGNKKVKFRVGKKNYHKTDVQWEGKCDFIFATLQEFINWTQPTISFKDIDPTKYWCYADYIYMRDLFSEVKDFNVLEEVRWSDLGFTGSEGCDSAIWIGSKGANTPCHYDTYGYNLVLQVYGQKRWTLFPPSDTNNLYPTRIPYEESSVFSQVNLLNPDPSMTRFQNCTPHVITLNPGDMLFVPQHWWHFVENLELSISVNAWFPCENDFNNRATEAVTRLLIGSLMPRLDAHDHVGTSWLNPNESMTSQTQNIELLRHALNEKSKIHKIKSEIGSNDIGNASEQCKCSDKQIVNELSKIDAHFLEKFCFKHSYLGEKKCKASKLKNLKNQINYDDKNSAKRQKLGADNNINDLITYKKFVECLTKPNVVSVILNELEKL